jgi:segregation and condensation protein A
MMLDETLNPPVTSQPQPESPQAVTGAVRATHKDTPAPPLKLDVYEGPLDLLLDLIRKQQINIYDIPIARVTGQYLDYLHMLEELNIDVAGEFIVMAATLIYIKSRTLLPPDPNAPAEEQEDPRTDLVQRLLEHEQFKNAAEMLQSKRMVEDAMWSQPGIGEFAEADDEPGLAVTVFDLISAFRQILEQAKSKPSLELRREQVTVRQMLEYLREALKSNPHPIRLDDLASAFLSRSALIALFIAMLEMVRVRAILLRQKDLFSPITLQRSPHFEETTLGANLEAIEADWAETIARPDDA